MKTRFFSIFRLTLLILCAAAILTSGAIGFFAWQQIRENTFTLSAPVIPEAASDSAQGVPVGEPFEISVETESAFSFETPFSIEFALPEGLEAAEKTVQDFRFAWTLRRGEIRISLLAFEAGTFENARITLRAKSSNGNIARELELPTLFAVLPPVAPDEKISLAGTLEPGAEESAANTYLWIAAVALPLAALALLIWSRRRSKQKPAPVIPPWVAAQSELDGLKREIDAGQIGAIAAVTRLSDIVRRYLAKRFTLSADAMTSQEFFSSMERYDSPLATPHKQFLREFLSAADLVKFAGFAATAEQTHSAIDRAALLVRETVPAPEPDVKK